MKQICDCYHEQEKFVGWLNSSEPIQITVGVCYGTKHCEECNCNGDTTKCDFYPEKRTQPPKVREQTDVERIKLLEKSNRNWRRKCQRLRSELKRVKQRKEDEGK